ncbi:MULTISPECIES: fibronectin type III domain-containing protein [unclassified Streptomyces]|uniref:fibronectin type III domain-containing protein n=1 Tax=unclassified Streptomyces TaxID=2593676 RepID=UPI002E291806|nr:PA14 domain-containing protein [Streptomyces sp. NBC_00223]
MGMRQLLWPAAVAAALLAGTLQGAPPRAAVPVAAAPVASVTCAAGVWKASYYANKKFSGTPKKSLCDTSIKKNWGSGHPVGIALPNNNFSVRWTMKRDFGGGGPFNLSVAGQDGIRVWIDSKRYINLWRDYSSTQRKTVRVIVPAGSHTLRVDYFAATGKANVSVGLAPATTSDRTAPAAPTAVKAVRGDTKASLSWSRNVEADLAGYRVYRNTSLPVPLNTSHRISGSKPRTSNSFSASGLHNGTKYWFVITGVDRSGNQSRASASVGAVPADTTAPRPPTDLDVDTYPEENALTWAPSQDDVVGDVVGYHVYRSLSATGPWTRLTTAPVAMNLFHDAKAPIGVRAYYRVTAVDEAKNESTPASASGTRPDDGSVTPPVPTGLKATAATGGITLGWGDNPAGSGAHGYNVYRSTAAAGTYTRLTATPITAPQYQDSQAPVGSVAYYRVTAVSKPDIFGVRHESAPAQTSATRPVPPDITPPPAPTGAQAVLNYAKTQVSVRWDPPTDTDTVRFELRRYLKDGTVQQVALSSPLFAGYGDRAPDAASVDSYLISAFDAAGNRSDTRVYVRWDSDAPPAAPTGLTVTPDTSGVALHWSGNTESDLKAYHVLRRDAPDAGYAEIASVPAGTTAWLDSLPPLHTELGYEVVAEDKGGHRGPPSQPVFTTALDTRPPAAPSVARTAVQGQAIVVTWDASPTPDVAGYRVYQSVDSTDGYALVAELVKEQRSWTDNDAAPGLSALYVVTAVDYSGNESKSSSPGEAVRPYPVGVAVPARATTLASAIVDKGVRLDWVASTTPEAAGYLVYRSRDAVGVAVADNLLTPTPVTATTFTDPAGRTAPRWYYAVVTVDGSGTRSLPATVRQDIDLQAPPMPSRLSAGLHTPPGYLEIQWDNAIAPGSDTVGYLVHWSATLAGPYTPLTPGLLVPTGPYGTFRIDSPPTGWSFFQVIAVDAVGNQSAPATAQAHV